MPVPRLLVSTWEHGLLCVEGDSVRQELADTPVRGLVAGAGGAAFAVAGKHSLRRRAPGGGWSEIAAVGAALSCCVTAGDVVYAGTDDARVVRIGPDGEWQFLTGFDGVEGREAWYAGAALVDGVLRGPPLGIRSIAATSDGALLANVHVGGIPRSADAGSSWRPTIDIEADVHEVRAHPQRPELAVAAAAAGLCVSRDGGASWSIEREGLHAPHCSAVALGRYDIFVSSSVDPFSAEGAVYKRPIDGEGALRPVDGGLPHRSEGRVDTGCIATNGAMVAVIDGSGALYLSQDDGTSWSVVRRDLPFASGLVFA